MHRSTALKLLLHASALTFSAVNLFDKNQEKIRMKLINNFNSVRVLRLLEEL